MIVNVTHDKNITTPFKSQAIFNIDVGFKNPRGALYLMTSQSRMPEIAIKKG